MSRIPTLTLLIAFAATGVHGIPGAAEVLQLDRAAVARGEVWRVLTCHLAHVSWDHLAWDVIVFVGLGWMLEREGPKRFALAILASAVAIPVTVLLFLPDLQLYRGLSGFDSLLFAMLAVDLAVDALRERRHARLILPAFLALAFAGKIGWESVAGTTVFVDSTADMVPVPLAHLAGAACGGLAAGAILLRSGLRHSRIAG